jgi:Rrf2 family iron-sulfur cluster assembly transcriptional regulator
MIRLSKRLLYTIDAVLDVALHEDAGAVRSTEITDREGIAARYLEPVLQQLVREKILIGSTGPTGGYRLGRAPEKISLGDLVRIVRGLETGEDPLTESSGSILARRVVRPLWTDLEAEMMQQLDGITIKQLLARARRAAD